MYISCNNVISIYSYKIWGKAIKLDFDPLE